MVEGLLGVDGGVLYIYLRTTVFMSSPPSCLKPCLSRTSSFGHDYAQFYSMSTKNTNVGQFFGLILGALGPAVVWSTIIRISSHVLVRTKKLIATIVYTNATITCFRVIFVASPEHPGDVHGSWHTGR